MASSWEDRVGGLAGPGGRTASGSAHESLPLLSDGRASINNALSEGGGTAGTRAAASAGASAAAGLRSKSLSDSQTLSGMQYFLYCAPSLGFAASVQFMTIFQFNYYTNTYNVPVNNLNVAFLLLQLFLFLGDPLVGWWTDVSSSRFGRRRPFIAVFGPLLMAVCFFGMYPVFTTGQVRLTVWFGVTYMLQNVVTMLFQSPYQALGIELTLDSRERNKLFGLTQTVYQLGIVVATAVPSMVLYYHNDTRAVYMWFGAGAAILGAASMVMLAVCIRETPEFAPPETTPLIAGMIRTMQNRAFWSLLVSITLLNCQPYYAVLLPYWAQTTLGLDSFWQSIVLTAWMVGSFVLMPVWAWIATRVGKKNTYLVSMLVAVVTFSSVLLVREGQKTRAVIVAFACGTSGISLNANNFLFQSLLADTIEYDQLRTGYRREAQYTNIVQVFNALTSVLSVSLPLYVMDRAGYTSSGVNSDRVRETIAFLIGPGAAIWCALAFGALLVFPITSEIHRRVIDGLAAHAQGKPALDPVTQVMVHAPTAAVNAVDERVGWFLDNFFAFELQASLRFGPPALLVVITGWIVLSLVGTAASLLWVFADVSRYLETGAFFAMALFAWLVFNCCRVMPAWQFMRAPVPAHTVRHHVEHGNNLVVESAR